MGVRRFGVMCVIMVSTLLRYRLQAAWNAVRFATPRQRALSIALSGLSILLALGVFVGFRLVMLMRGSGQSATDIVHELVYAVFLFMLAGSVPFLAATLLHPGDVALLGAAPIRPTHVVFVRLLEGAAAGAAQFAPIGAPAVVACGAGLGYGWGAWLGTSLVALSLVAMPAVITATLLFASVAVMGHRRVRAAIAMVNVLLGSLVCLTAVSQVTGLRMQEGLAGLAGGSANPSGRLAYLPPWCWIADGMIALSHNDGRLIAEAAARVLGATVALGMAAVMFGGRLLREGRLTDDEGVAARRAGGRNEARRGARPLMSGTLAALIGKEVRYIMRDSLLLSQAGMPAILYLVPFVMAMNPGFREANRGDTIFAFGVVMTMAVLYMQSSILSLSSLGLEGRAFWIVLASPGRVRAALAAKWLVSWWMASLAGIAMVTLSGMAFSADWPTVVALDGVVVVTAAGLCGIGVGLAASLPRFVFENPAHRVSPLAIVLGFGIGVAYAGCAWAVLSATWYAGTHWPLHATAIHAAGITLVALATALAVAVPLAAGYYRLSGLEWEY